jgi:hypothetical protein
MEVTMRSLAKLLLLIVVTVTTANASIVIPFSGSGASGTIAPGEAWAINQLSTFNWGSPGVGMGFETWNASIPVEDFTITFTSLVNGVQITNLETGPTCGNGSQTVFCEASGTLIPWTPALSNGGTAITFTAPSPLMLLPGDSFYINIYFSGDEGSSVTFTGGWSQETVPEPLTLGLTASGLLTIALRHRRLWFG